jgi:two-component system sensor histidine kinase ChvG
MFRGILSKILGLSLMFNLALWAFVIATEDAAVVEIRNKKDRLFERSNFYVKLLKPIFQQDGLSEFDRRLAIESVLLDRTLAGMGSLKVSSLLAGSQRIYFDGANPRTSTPIEVQPLPDAPERDFTPDVPGLDPFEALFVVYKHLFDLQIVTVPYEAKRARFTRQFQLLNPLTDLYELSYLVPIQVDGRPRALLEISDSYYLREAYFGKNKSRLMVMIGLSGMTIIFGALLAISIAMPIRRLSRRLNRRLKAETLVEQLAGFEIEAFETRRDEVGRLYRNLSRLHQQIITVFHDKERFAADVSHELKNPIASIIANTQNAMAEATTAERAKFAAIQNQAVRMNKLISEISEAAIVDHDLVSAKRERFNLSETIGELIGFFEPAANAAQLRLTFDIESHIHFTGLPDRLARVVINLVENALSFAGPQGQVHIALSKTWRQGLVLKVSDTGPGIAMADRTKIFERFYSAREDKEGREGNSGLGLYICQQIVEAHGGSLTVTQCPKLGGALFEITLS